MKKSKLGATFRKRGKKMIQEKPNEPLVFKKILGSKGNEEVLRDLIRDITDLPVKWVEIINPYHYYETYRDYEYRNCIDDYNVKIAARVHLEDSFGTEVVEITLPSRCRFNHGQFYSRTTNILGYDDDRISWKVNHEIAFLDFEWAFDYKGPGIKKFKMINEEGKILKNFSQVYTVELHNKNSSDPKRKLVEEMRSFFIDGIVLEGSPEWLVKIAHNYTEWELDEQERQLLNDYKDGKMRWYD